MKCFIYAGGLCALWAAAPCLAEYVVDIRSGGASSAVVNPGESLSLDVVLSSDSGNTHTSAIVRVEFSSGGLVYQSLNWHAPYSNDPLFEDSTPSPASLPLMLDDLVLSGPGYPAGVVDVELSNIVDTGPFGVGTMATLVIQIPSDYAGPGLVQIVADPDTIASGFDVVPSVGGQAFELTIVPGPGVFSAFGVGMLWGGRRRRRRTR